MASAAATGADALVFDLEDAVPEAAKELARGLVSDAVAEQGVADVPVFVRVNDGRSGLQGADLSAVVRSGLAGVRLPKVESADEVRSADELITSLEERGGLERGTVAIVCNIESARGVHEAARIAGASRRVLALAFGAADFARDVGAEAGPERTETLYARSHLVIASRVAGIRPPIDGVHVRLDDELGLEVSTRASKALGFFGRSAIHPRQLGPINAIYTPSAAEVRRAREIVAANAQALMRGDGSTRSTSGDFVDTAIVRRAEDVLRLAASLSKVAV
jgi:citrate lyase subunit beta/citryl-CoA lyase